MVSFERACRALFSIFQILDKIRNKSSLPLKNVIDGDLIGVQVIDVIVQPILEIVSGNRHSYFSSNTLTPNEKIYFNTGELNSI